ncbi:MAG TPA: sigma 54-interacting transcriptional regulator [Pyrinomonadaceae bacterium]|nr:sigma 54-interacting transcriptional regulator [Pyrinomonadaceae bacterium]
MNPRLIAISGTLKGTIFDLVEDEILIGREPSNPMCLNDLSVSRRHCLIKRERAQTQNKMSEAKPQVGDVDTESGQPERDGQAATLGAITAGPANREDVIADSQFTISDLESYNGTFVNGVPVKEHPLAHGDQIAVGDVVLLFLLHEAEVARETTGQSQEDNLITRSTVRLRREDALYLHPERLEAELPATSRATRDLNALLKISTTINSGRGLSELQSQLLQLILEIIPAQREAILLVDRSQAVFSLVSGWDKVTGRDDSITVSQTISRQVLREGVALLSNDLLATGGPGGTPSLAEARVCSVLCVPLIGFEGEVGVIYLDTSDPAARFDEGHLQLLTAIAAIAAAPLENARRVEWLEDENQRLQEEIHVEHQMIGENAAIQAVYKLIGKVAPTDATVLIRGESGTGKELAARAIHGNSARAANPFIAINGATLSETLLESELFGHEKGAFTGAIAQKRGKLEIADGGTLFLDEIGELTPLIQAKLLRVLQEHEFERVGGTRSIKVDVRVVTATNKDLDEAVSKGAFRQDLYYRLNVVSITMPPLRNRRDDIQLLASYFASVYSKKCKRRIKGISAEARALLRAYDWPGNVRELQNAIERAVVLGSTELLTPEDLPEALFETGDNKSLPVSSYHDKVAEAKKLIVIKAVEEADGNYTEAAKQLGIHPTNLHRLIRTLGAKRQRAKR